MIVMENFSDTSNSFLYCGLAVWIFQTLLYIVALVKRKNDLADIGWPFGFVIVGIVACIWRGTTPDPDWSSQYTILAFVSLWGLRLGTYLFTRNWSKPEDWRYAKWREEWGRNVYWRSYLQVFLLQGILMLIIASPVVLVFASPIDFQEHHYMRWSVSVLFAVSVVLWLLGFFFEAVGDYQLAQFKKDPANKGKVMRYGVWQYTRHPNYFGEASMWWGIFLLSCVSAHGVIDILLRAIGPATITFLLLRVSGVTMLESKYKGNKEYEDYQKRTSAFIPLPTKKGAV